jgi:CheY-like chemotaxis protein
MKKPTVIETGKSVIHVLAVLPNEQDQRTLETMLPSSKWSVHKAHTLLSAVEQLRGRRLIGVVLCERDLLPGSWKDLLDYIRRMGDPPLLIVASRLADEQLWAEALNLGAYDVLSEPFDATEVTRILSLTWLRWRATAAPPPPAPRKVTPAEACCSPSSPDRDRTRGLQTLP